MLIIVQNLPVPFDRRVWQEATELANNGYTVSVICPKGKGHEQAYEVLNGVHIYRHPLPYEAKGAPGYLIEYAGSLFFEFLLCWKVLFAGGFDVIHACNPPDNIFLIGGFFKLFGKRFLFDHHDINPELYEAKFRRRDFFHRILLLWERLTFMTADVSIATNDSYRRIAVARGRMPPGKVFVVRSGPSLERMKILPPSPGLKKGRRFLVGYVGVMGRQEGIEHLIEAARILTQEMGRPDVHFALVGSGPALEDLKKRAREKGVADCMTFFGRAPDAVLLEVLNTADICVNPDEVNPMNDQSTMNKIMEYMALGKPIVQFDVREGKFSAGASSFYAKANDARDFAGKIAYLLDHPAEREEMGRLGRRRVEQELAWPYEAPKLLAAYDAVFAVKKPAAGRKIIWYANRLASMSPPELFHRIHEAFKRRLDQAKPGRYSPAAADDGPLPSLPGLREGFAARDVPAHLLAQWEAQRGQAQKGRFRLLGQEWPECPPEKKWRLDPVTGAFWPAERYCFSIDFRHAPDKGDVKYVWELNRLQYLQPIAALAFVRKDAALAHWCVGEIESWIDNNPPLKGLAWASGIELALRIVSILVVMTLAGESASATQRAKIRATLEAHGLWLARYPSRFSSANNHQAAEGLGLFLLGALCPSWQNAAAWKAKGLKRLSAAAQMQILDDGVGVEQAISYGAFVLEMLLLGLHVAKATGTDLPGSYADRIMRGGEYMRWLTDAGGNQPRIGDDDNGSVLGGSEGYITSILAAVASVFERADLAPPNVQPHFRQALFGLPPAAANRPEGLRIFDAGGYTVSRHHAQGKDILLAMDHGPLGYLSLAAHGHADALSIWLHIGSQPVLVDAGTYLYHSGGAWRRHFRSTQAHNTLCIEDKDASTMSGAFNWSHKARARLNRSEITDDHWWIEAEQDGYLRRFGCLHRRRLSVRPSRGFITEDSLTGDKAHRVSIGFLLHPDVRAVLREDGIDVMHDQQILMHIHHEGPLAAMLGEGWYSPAFGEKTSAARIVFHGLLAPGQKAVTHFIFTA